jgi:hypothetical protein
MSAGTKIEESTPAPSTPVPSVSRRTIGVLPLRTAAASIPAVTGVAALATLKRPDTSFRLDEVAVGSPGAATDESIFDASVERRKDLPPLRGGGRGGGGY